LLGDPGAGKTSAFEQEAEETGGILIKARDFATFDPQPISKGVVLFIDGLDEMRAGSDDAKGPLDIVRRNLQRVGYPRFRLSCRDADWLGASDSHALTSVSPNGDVSTLRLEPLTDSDIVRILTAEPEIREPSEFIAKATQFGLRDLLKNPHTLRLIIEAVKGNDWPNSRKSVYDMACKNLMKEMNKEHRNARREGLPPSDALLNAAGFLGAVQLLSGIAGYALDLGASGRQHVEIQNLSNAFNLPLLPAMRTALFQADGEERRIPIHRSIAEYLGARFIANEIEAHGLPVGRVLALITAGDGGIFPDLRGLAAWLSVHCLAARRALIERDPLGIVLYGDVKEYPASDKDLILEAFGQSASRFHAFRFEDWTSAPLGALCTADMESTFSKVLVGEGRDKESLAIVDCVLDAMRHGEHLQNLDAAVLRIVGDSTYRPSTRVDALDACLTFLNPDDRRLKDICEKIRDGAIEDRDDEVLGTLLSALYPLQIQPVEVLDYFHPLKDGRLLGRYFRFWRSEVAESTPEASLPMLLDQMVERRKLLDSSERDSFLSHLVGDMLRRVLDEHGDRVDDVRLSSWLSIGLDKYSHPRLENKLLAFVRQWLEARPKRYKGVLNNCFDQCRSDEKVRYCLYSCMQRLYGARPPEDIHDWYIDKAKSEADETRSEFYFDQAVMSLQSIEADLLVNLDVFESWIKETQKFEKWILPFISCEIGDWRQQNFRSEREHKDEWRKRQGEWMSFFLKNIDSIRQGTAHAKILHDLALAHMGMLLDASGETPEERLSHFLANDQALIKAAHQGFRNSLTRQDLPTVEDILSSDAKGKMFFIRSPVLVGIQELFDADADAVLRLDDSLLRRLIAFHLTHSFGDDLRWFKALLSSRPALVADVIALYEKTMMRTRKDHISQAYSLAFNEDYAAVAPLVLPILLNSFPMKALKKHVESMLDSLLKGALRHIDRSILGELVQEKLQHSGLDSAQKVYWLATGLLIDPEKYESALAAFIGKSTARTRQLSEFLHARGMQAIPDVVLPDSVLGLLIEMLAPGCSPERPNGAHFVTAPMHTADLVRSSIHTLGGSTKRSAANELERLLTRPSLSRWHDALRASLYSQRIAVRKAEFRPLSPDRVSRTLSNSQPSNAADLSALVYEAILDIGRNIRDSSTNDYKQYWSYDSKNARLIKSKPENDCRDALLSDLKERIGKLGIDAVKEGYYADDKRADIRVSFGGATGINIPIEIKKDRHSELWTALQSQLVGRYTRDPGTDGYGIYAVFWFGGEGMPPPEIGRRPRTPLELEKLLRSTIPVNVRSKISICVIDCSLPDR
jgi:hypothetical protein